MKLLKLLIITELIISQHYILVKTFMPHYGIFADIIFCFLSVDISGDIIRWMAAALSAIELSPNVIAIIDPEKAYMVDLLKILPSSSFSFFDMASVMEIGLGNPSTFSFILENTGATAFNVIPEILNNSSTYINPKLNFYSTDSVGFSYLTIGKNAFIISNTLIDEMFSSYLSFSDSEFPSSLVLHKNGIPIPVLLLCMDWPALWTVFGGK